MNINFGHSRYLTNDGHMQMDAYGDVYMKQADGQTLIKNIMYNIYERKEK